MRYLIRPLLTFLCLSLLPFSAKPVRAAACTVYMGGVEGEISFFGYDVESNTWSSKANMPAGSCGTITTDGSLVYMIGCDNQIYSYDPNADAWSPVRSGPDPSLFGNTWLFRVGNNQEFFAAQPSMNALRYSSGDTWNTLPLPAPASAASSFAAAENVLYVRIYGRYGPITVDATTHTVLNTCNIGQNGEHDRVGTYYQGTFYGRDGCGSFRKVDPTTCDDIASGATPGGCYMASDVDDDGNIYLTPWNDNTPGLFQQYNTADNSIVTLAEAPRGQRLTTAAVVPCPVPNN